MTAPAPLRHFATLPLALSAALLCAGCLTSSSSNVKMTGRYIGDQTIARIELGKTDRQWILAVLGEPSTKSNLNSGLELWKWEYTRVKTSSGSVLFVASGHNSEETIRNVYVEFKGDIVSQCWRD